MESEVKSVFVLDWGACCICYYQQTVRLRLGYMNFIALKPVPLNLTVTVKYVKKIVLSGSSQTMKNSRIWMQSVSLITVTNAFNKVFLGLV